MILIFRICICLWVPIIAVYSGFVFLSGDDSDDGGHCETPTSCSGLIVHIMSECISESNIVNAKKDILAIGIQGGQSLSAFHNWQSALGFTYDIAATPYELAALSLSDYKVIFFPSDEYNTYGGIPCSLVTTIVSIKATIANYVNVLGGSLMTLVQGNCASAYLWLPTQFSYQGISESNPTATPYLNAIVPAVSSATLAHCCYHIEFTGPVGYNGMNVLASDPYNGYPIILGGLNIILTTKICNDGTHANDPDCAETQCFDGLDNNLNGFTDCLDPHCQVLFAACQPTRSPVISPTYKPTTPRPSTSPTTAPTHAPTPAPSPRECQGVLRMVNITVACDQYRDFEQYVLYSGHQADGTLPHNLVVLNGSTGEASINDTSINCVLYGDVNYVDYSLLPVTGMGAGPDHSFTMLQRYSLSNEQIEAIRTNSIRTVMLFMKGSVVPTVAGSSMAAGNGISRVYAATAWESLLTAAPDDARTLCPRGMPKEFPFSVAKGYEIIPADSIRQQLADHHCAHVAFIPVTHIYGWVLVNVTDIINCQVNHGSNELNLLWTQGNDDVAGQLWHSSKSLDGRPLLVAYALL